MLLQYDLSVVGAKNVDRALASVEHRLVQHNRFSERLFGKPTSRTSTAAGASRAAQRETKAVASAAGTLDRQRSQALYKQYRDRERLEQRAVKQQSAAASALDRQRSTALFREFKDREKLQQRHERESVRNRLALHRDFTRRTGRIVSNVAGTVGAVGTAGLAVTGLAGGALIASKLADATQLERRQRQVIVNARGPGQQGAFSYEGLREQINQTSISSGISAADLTGGVEKFVQKTGDIKTAVANMKIFATTAMATGASVEDVSSAAADLAQKFKISKVEDMADALAVLTFQGKKGAFELRDMAEQFPEMAAAAERAGLSGAGGLKTFGGLAQIARESTGTGAEASTAVQMMLTQLVHESDKLKSGEALGGRKVNIFTGKDATTPLRDVREVLADVISSSHGNLQQLQNIFDQRGMKAVSPMIGVYRKASEAVGGGKAGETAGREAILKMIAEHSDTGGTFADVQRDAADIMKSSSAQLEILNTKLSEAIQAKLLPAMVRLIPVVSDAVPYFARLVEGLASLVDWLHENPWKGLGAVVAGVITKELVMAGLGMAAEKAVAAAFSASRLGGGVGGTVSAGGGGGSLPTGGGGGGLAGGIVGTALAGLTIASLAVTTFTAGTLVIDQLVQSNKKDVEDLVKSRNARTPEEMRAALAGDEQRLNELKAKGTEPSPWLKIGSAALDEILGSGEGVGGIRAKFGVTEKDVQEGVAAEQKANTEMVKQLTAEIANLKAQLSKPLQVEMAGVVPNRGNAPSSPIKG
jgi:hypothetical protein